MAITYALLQQQGDTEQSQDATVQINKQDTEGEGVQPDGETNEDTTLPHTTVGAGESKIVINTKE
jgi:hypothetical protein